MKINEELQDLLEAFQLYEMAIYYGTDHGTCSDVVSGFKKLNQYKEGMLHISQTLKVEKEVTQKEIDLGLFDPIYKGIPKLREYPIILVWGEKDKTKGYKRLEGHGIVHMLQGHENLSQVMNRLNVELQKNVPAKVDKYGNYSIRLSDYRFAFMLVDREDGTPDHAVLVTAFKK